MSEPYPVQILGAQRTVIGFSEDVRFLLLEGATPGAVERYRFDLWDQSAVDAQSTPLLEVARLKWVRAEGWFLNGEALEVWLRAMADHAGEEKMAAGEWPTDYLRLRILAGQSGPLGKLPEGDRETVCAVAWFKNSPDWPHLLRVFEKVENPEVKHNHSVVFDEAQLQRAEAAVQQHAECVTKQENLASRQERATERGEATVDQLGAKTSDLAETIEPLVKLYSEPAMAEVRKRANGQGVPDMFTNWALARFRDSGYQRLPTKGQAMRDICPETPLGRKLTDAGYGISRTRLANHLTVLRRLLITKGLPPEAPPGKARKRAPGYDPASDRHEDINQPTPYESAADRDDARTKVDGLAPDGD